MLRDARGFCGGLFLLSVLLSCTPKPQPPAPPGTNAPEPVLEIRSFTPVQSTNEATKNVWGVECNWDVPGEIQRVTVWFDTEGLQRLDEPGFPAVKDALGFLDADGKLIEEKELFAFQTGNHVTVYDKSDDGETFAYSKGDTGFDQAAAAVRSRMGLKVRTGHTNYGVKTTMVKVTYLPKQQGRSGAR